MKRSRASSRGSVRAFDLRFRQSPRLLVACLILHALVIVLLACMLAPLPASALSGLCLISLAACGRLPGIGWARGALASASAHEDGSWTLVERGGRSCEAWLADGLVLSPNLQFIHWITASGRHIHLLLTGDSIQPDGRRRLRARLHAVLSSCKGA